MNHEGGLPPPQPDLTPGPWPGSLAAVVPSRSWFGRYGIIAGGAGGALVVGAVVVAAALLLAQPNPSIEKMVPATHDVLVIGTLTPSLAQKVIWLRAFHSFPDTKTDAAISAKLDEAFKAAGLSFTNDVQPWLGGEGGGSGKVNIESPTDSPFPLFATSPDDTTATAVLAKLRGGSFGKKYAWRNEPSNGIALSSGTPTVTS